MVCHWTHSHPRGFSEPGCKILTLSCNWCETLPFFSERIKEGLTFLRYIQSVYANSSPCNTQKCI